MRGQIEEAEEWATRATRGIPDVHIWSDKRVNNEGEEFSIPVPRPGMIKLHKSSEKLFTEVEHLARVIRYEYKKELPLGLLEAGLDRIGLKGKSRVCAKAFVSTEARIYHLQRKQRDRIRIVDEIKAETYKYMLRLNLHGDYMVSEERREEMWIYECQPPDEGCHDG
jgi:hypothetical protein